MTTNPHIGSDFEDFLRDESILEEVTATAVKRTLALQLEEEIKRQHISKSELARRLNTSPTQIARLLDPDNDRVQLDTLQKAAVSVGKRLSLELVDAQD